MTDGSAEARLRELGITLPEGGGPAGSYRTAVAAGDLLHLSGHGPLIDGKPTHLGRVPSEVDIDAARAAARLTAVNLLATLRSQLGALDRVDHLVKLTGFVLADADFTEHARVTDGGSELLVAVLGPERGAHVRTSVGVASLPFRLCVELDLVARIKPDGA